MASRTHLDWFRGKLAENAEREVSDTAPLLKWRENLVNGLSFSAELIGLDEVRGWKRNEQDNIAHETGQFFSIEGTRITAGDLREVKSWDQPIYNQPEGGVLAMVAREDPEHGVQFLLQAKAEPGNIGWLQFCPSIQCTWSNLKQAHKGKKPPLAEIMLAEKGVRLVYQAQHNEEGGRFWRKSNENIIYFLDDETIITTDLTYFYWASLSQIKELALIDNVVSPFVKSIISPL